MKKFFTILCLYLFSTVLVLAQQNIFAPQEQLVSPVVHDNGSVSLYLRAPHAEKVEVRGDWMQAGTTEVMQKNENGVWSYTSAVLPSDLYIYQFIVDGTTITDPLSVYQIRDVSNLFTYFIIPGEQGNLYQVNDIPHGTVAKPWYDSPTLGIKRRITIYTPPGYEESKISYPVLYLLHGMGGDEDAWPMLGRTAQILDNLIASGKCKPMIVVMPNGNVAQQAAPGESPLGQAPVNFMLPHTMDGTYENAFKDIISFTEKNYRVEANKDKRAIAGLSMGGYHSLWTSLNYPDTFGYVGLFSAAIMPGRRSNPEDGGVPAIYEDMDKKLIQQKENGLNLYWIAIGNEDFLLEDNNAYREKLNGIDFPYQYTETGKGHVWSNWRIYLSQFVPLLF